MGQILSEGTPTSILHALSTTRISAHIQQLGAGVSISDLYDATVITDIGELAVSELADQAARTVDRYIFGQIINHDTQIAGDSVLHFFKTSTEVTEYWGETSTISAGIMTVSSTNVLATSDLRMASYRLRQLGAEPYDGKNYIAIMNSETAEDIAGDSTWIDWHQYPANEVEALYAGEIGRVYGIRVVEDNAGPAKRGSNYGATASSIAYGTVIFGKGFYGVTELDGGIKRYGPLNTSEKADILNQQIIHGWKCDLAAQVLNPSAGCIFWAGSGDTTTADAESASSGLRHEAPASY